MPTFNTIKRSSMLEGIGTTISAIINMITVANIISAGLNSALNCFMSIMILITIKIIHELKD